MTTPTETQIPSTEEWTRKLWLDPVVSLACFKLAELRKRNAHADYQTVSQDLDTLEPIMSPCNEASLAQRAFQRLKGCMGPLGHTLDDLDQLGSPIPADRFPTIDRLLDSCSGLTLYALAFTSGHSGGETPQDMLQISPGELELIHHTGSLVKTLLTCLLWADGSRLLGTENPGIYSVLQRQQLEGMYHRQTYLSTRNEWEWLLILQDVLFRASGQLENINSDQAQHATTIVLEASIESIREIMCVKHLGVVENSSLNPSNESPTSRVAEWVREGVPPITVTGPESDVGADVNPVSSPRTFAQQPGPAVPPFHNSSHEEMPTQSTPWFGITDTGSQATRNQSLPVGVTDPSETSSEPRAPVALSPNLPGSGIKPSGAGVTATSSEEQTSEPSSSEIPTEREDSSPRSDRVPANVDASSGFRGIWSEDSFQALLLAEGTTG
ncbi:hypothetical protein M231_06810 [Tremella mesenterica]|uniref:Uncharacterized protein n=1 Tax=Tremella mesenterica TaxID=5217 RepID=A0A4Q1BDI2_TREME|nr:hypothetical protein M231_06810 [Tremella mesenterica]